MRHYETTTASGSGMWGSQLYEVSLVKATSIYSDEKDKNKKTVTGYDIHFKQPSSPTWDNRAFKTEQERTAFVKQHFSSINWTEPPQTQEAHKELPHILTAIIGEYLSSVTFVMDYVQLDFNGHGLNLYVWPVVVIGDRASRQQEIGYRDALCALIGKNVERVDEYFDVGLVVGFQGNSLLKVPLRVEEESALDELVEYRGLEGAWVIWQAHEEPYT